MDQAEQLPQPDTSWMSDPWPRSKFTGWMGYGRHPVLPALVSPSAPVQVHTQTRLTGGTSGWHLNSPRDGREPFLVWPARVPLVKSIPRQDLLAIRPDGLGIRRGMGGRRFRKLSSPSELPGGKRNSRLPPDCVESEAVRFSSPHELPALIRLACRTSESRPASAADVLRLQLQIPPQSPCGERRSVAFMGTPRDCSAGWAWSLFVVVESFPTAAREAWKLFRLASRAVGMLSSPHPRPHLSLFRRRIEDFAAQPVQILAGESGVDAKSLFGTTPDWLCPARQALPECFGMAGQGADRPFDVLVAIHVAAEPGEVRGFPLEDLGDGLAFVLAEGHGGFVAVGHIIFIGSGDRFFIAE